MTKGFLTIVLILLSIPAYSNWAYVNEIDSFTDEHNRLVTFSDSEHYIQLSYKGSAVWMFIRRKNTGEFEPLGLIELRVDKNKTFVINPEDDKLIEDLFGRLQYYWEPSLIGFLLWHGLNN